MTKVTDEQIRSLSDFTDHLDLNIQNVFKNIILKTKADKSIEVTLEGPNIIFKTGEIQYQTYGLKFKPKTNHKNWSDVLGCISIGFGFKQRFLKEKEVENKVNKVVEMTIKLVEADFKQEDNNVLWLH